MKLEGEFNGNDAARRKLLDVPKCRLTPSVYTKIYRNPKPEKIERVQIDA